MKSAREALVLKLPKEEPLPKTTDEVDFRTRRRHAGGLLLKTPTPTGDFYHRSPPPIRVSRPLSFAEKKADDVCLSPGYESYSKKLLLLQLPTEYDLGSHDDLSADEAYEITPVPEKKNSNWRKVRNVVQWTPFIQTYKRHKYPWVQLAGHQGNFKAGYKQGSIMKKLCPAEEKALNAIMKDVLKPYVPEYMGVEEASDGERYLSLQDLLSSFTSPCVMDVKMGVRTYLEEELAKARHKPKLRKDMYEKMVQIDPEAPTEAERLAKAVTKPRYMVWRETISSTSTLGFRIEGVRRGDGSSSKDFKTTKSRDQVTAAFKGFMKGHKHAGDKYIKKLREIKTVLEKSEFFNSHELIGSSLLFVHSDVHADVWMIDFAKTCPLPGGVSINHKKPWVEGTHEDGYLIGLDNLITLIENSKETGEGMEETTRKTEGIKTIDPKIISAASKDSNVTNDLDTSITKLNLENKEAKDVILKQTNDEKVHDSTVKISNYTSGDTPLMNNVEESSSGYKAGYKRGGTTPPSLFKKR